MNMYNLDKEETYINAFQYVDSFFSLNFQQTEELI